ncbi:hypothetical protein Back11_16940 [Paenibacillus baekrokdamisoli]|uniref:VanZ-like domain-containing protein n=1 Tax=Paenibacillus baekrokdamisoli TaxID=1712516 RepID=A0A3G9JBG5_9BACL|nr:hypothetical protein Back11_16940 [Paenibacillus baekrokdamisoli]
MWSQPASYVQLVKGRAFLQTVFNFLLLFPFGVYIRYFFNNRKSWKRALLLGFSLSLFFEVTQLTGVFGYFNCPYRLFDVDDLMVNSSGTLCGFLIAPIVLALFPSSKSIEAKRERILEKDIVFPLPQLLALLIDYIVFQLVYLPLASLFSSDWLTDFVCASLTFVLVLYLVPLVWQGKTIGSAILRFRFLDKNTGKPFARSLFKRFLSLYLPWLLFHVLSAIGGIEIDQDSAFYPYQVWFNVGVLLFYFLFILVLFIHVILVVFSHGRRQFYFDYASGIRPSRRPQRPKENKHAT